MEPEPDQQRPGSRQGDERGFTTGPSTNDGRDELKVVYLRDHQGVRYVFPYELCRSKEDAESLWKHVYAKHDQQFLERIIKDDYVVRIWGARILPSVWDAIVQPGSTIDIEFPEERVDFSAPRRPLPRSRSISPPRDEQERLITIYNDARAVTFDLDTPRPPARRRESDLSSSTDSSESDSSISDQSLPLEQLEPPEPPRNVDPPVDAEGNQLSFQVNTKHMQTLIGLSQEPSEPNNDREVFSAKNNVGDYRVDTFRITRAMVEEAQGRSQLQIHVLPGPENPHLQTAVATTWYHISASQLDFTRFRDVCLTIPHVGDRLRKLTAEMLNKLHTGKVKPFDGGMFIEPGMALRADESDQPEPQSVIFSCVPYLALETQAKKSPGTENNLFPQRTLMQTFYPYEPVRERDREQSYKRFGNNRSENIIHVPNMWIMIMGSSHVVTCGHLPLSKEMVKSMALIEEDIKQLGMKHVAENNVTMIRFTDWGERDFILPISTCRSYFELEANVRNIGHVLNNKNYDAEIRLQNKTSDGSFSVTPKKWKDVIMRTDLLLINLAIAPDDMIGQPDQHSPMMQTANDQTASNRTSVPPFFHWPQQRAGEIVKNGKEAILQDSFGTQQPSRCLEQVEKALMTETLFEGGTTNAVDETFTSNNYYESLPKATYADAHANFADLTHRCKGVRESAWGSTLHQMTIGAQRTGMLERAIEFFKVARMISQLFFSDNDKNNTVSKMWGVMVKIYERVIKLENYKPSSQGSDKDTAAPQGNFRTTENSWLIRSPAKPSLVPLPDSSPELMRSIAQCKRCKNLHSFRSQEDALGHLQRHVNLEVRPPTLQTTTETDALPEKQSSAEDAPLDPRLKEWVVASAEFWHEQTNAGTLAILTKACILAKNMFEQAQELMDGVQNEDGQMSDLYTLPKELVETYRLIMVFFMATERALEDADNAHEQEYRIKDPYERSILPYSEKGLEVLEKFERGAMRSLKIARLYLCSMARLFQPLDTTKHLSRGPEYICGWLIRRLLLQPLEKHDTAGDLYREYISRLQFQVNHHPSKRLLRDLNLLQEELQILSLINNQQANLVRNYLCVLDDSTYEKAIPYRQSMFPYERRLMNTCLDSLSLVMEDYEDLIHRCGPLASRTKQSLEINEEDHGKAIMVFTVVTVIFLPLSFATSYFGMNTADIRDMDQKQGLFWGVAIPLTVVTVGACLLIGYNGDDIRDIFVSLYRKAMGKQERNTGDGGISVPRRKRPLYPLGNSSSTLESSNILNEAEFVSLRPALEYNSAAHSSWLDDEDEWYTVGREPSGLRTPKQAARSDVRTQTFVEPITIASEPSYRLHSRPRAPRYTARMPHQYGYNERSRRSPYDSYPDVPAHVSYDVDDQDNFMDGARHVRSSRRVYVSPGPLRTDMPSRLLPARAYASDPFNDDEVDQYAWKKKKKSHRSHEAMSGRVKRDLEAGYESRGERFER